jgi:hypothetical protein
MACDPAKIVDGKDDVNVVAVPAKNEIIDLSERLVFSLTTGFSLSGSAR